MKLKNVFANILEAAKSNINKNFWAWFSNSLATRDGKPAIFYHGTSAIFDEFKFASRGAFGLGYYFTTDKKEAKGYGSKMMNVYLKIEKPATPKDVQTIIKSIPDWNYLDEKELARQVTEGLKSAGFDGILFTYPSGDLLAMVINANQVKSVKNKGDWGSSNNIYDSFDTEN